MSRIGTRGALLAALGAALTIAALAAAPPPARAQAPPATEEQALAIERQLLCPQCTNKRLDVCELAICVDMKRIIRERLAAGSTPDDVILYFENRYGERIRADLPKEGFNLLLFAWVGAAIVGVAGAGAYYLVSLRRRAAARAEPPPDDPWLDDVVARIEDS